MVWTRALFLIVALSLLVTMTLGDDAKPVDPWSFKSPRAIRAKSEYDAAVAKAQAQADDLKSTARAKLLKNLEGAMADATRAADLDEAVKIKAAINDLKAGTEKPHSASDLERRIIGTRWLVNRVDLVFGKGVYTYSDWGDKHGTWAVKTAQTIACVGPDGKKFESTFDPDFAVVVSVADGACIGVAPREKDK